MTTHQTAVLPKPTLALEIITDYICPWCYIGKAQLQKALEPLRDAYQVTLSFSPSELNPQMPAAGLDRKAYRTSKFGSWEQSLALDRAVVEAGNREGLSFNYDKVLRTPNTFLAHRLTWYAGRFDKQEAVVTALFAAYFGDGLDIGSRDVLARVAATCGLDEKRVAAFLDSTEGDADVRRMEQASRGRGIGSVPVFVMHNQCIEGAQPMEVLRAFILQQVNQSKHA